MITRLVPPKATVVVIGGGIMGASTAYNLVKRGVTDVVVLEKGAVTSGTTWHAAGLVSQLKSSHALSDLAVRSLKLYAELEEETGQATGFRTPGSISIAATPARLEEMKRTVSMSKTLGLDVREIGHDELRERVPLIRTDDVLGAFFNPNDGMTSPVDTTMALLKGATMGGAQIFENVGVKRILRDGTKCIGVELDDANGTTIEADAVVVASGMWSRELASAIGVNVPLQACEHFYIVTEPLEGVERGMPVVRDPENLTYFKEETGKLMAGFFEPRGKVWNLDGIPRDWPAFGTIPEDRLDHLLPLIEAATRRIPALEGAGVQLFFNGPESFTPDGRYLLGESAEVEGCFIAAGFNSVGIQSAGGAGWALAGLIVDGYAPIDLSSVDVKRASPFQGKKTYLAARIPESLGLLYAMHWPFRQYESARGERHSVLHDAIAQRGAVFGETAGWERPNWYAEEGEAKEYVYSYDAQNWHNNMVAECAAVRSGVGIFDQSSFAKFELRGEDALSVLNELSANEIDVENNRAVYTQWLNERGGIEADLTCVRGWAEEEEVCGGNGPVGGALKSSARRSNSFLVVTSAACETRDWALLSRACCRKNVELCNVTDDFAVIGVMGPNSRALLAPLCAKAGESSPLESDAFPFGAMRSLTISGVQCSALRMSYVGELGYEIYVRRSNAVAVHSAIANAAESAAQRDLGARHCGFHAMNALRLEAGYRHWGHDICAEDTPLESGLGFAVAWDKEGGFRGRDALVAQKAAHRNAPPKRLIQLRVEDENGLLSHHDDPIFRNGKLVGRTTGGMWSPLQDRSLAMAYVTRVAEENSGSAGGPGSASSACSAATPRRSGVTKAWLNDGEWEIEIGMRRRRITPQIKPFYKSTTMAH